MRSRLRHTLFFIALSGSILVGLGGTPTGRISDEAVQSARSNPSLIDESFGSAAAAADFTVIAGGAWVSGQYVFALTHPIDATAAVGNPNVVVHNLALSGDWTLTARMAAVATLAGRDSYSLIFGLSDGSDYFYANIGTGAGAGQNGVFKMSAGQSTQVAAFPATQFTKANKNDDLSLVKSGTTVAVIRNGSTLGAVTDPSLGGAARVGFGSRGSVVTARHLLVVRGGSPPPTPSPTGTSTPAPTPSPSVTATPTSTPSPAPPPVITTPTPTSTPTPPAGGGGAGLAGFFGPWFQNAPFCTFSHQNVSITGGVLTATYPAGSTAPSAGAPYGGAQICLPFAGGGATDATLTYDIRFPVGFQFVRGGKLPGVYGGVEPFSGGSHNANGWSMRLMWRPNGAAEVYGYISTSSGYGDSWGRGNFSFKADGQWHHLIEHVHLNTPGVADGYVTLAYDGTQYISQTGLAITTTNTPVSGLFFSTFYGGHDPSWAPSATMHIDFANFRRS